MKVQKTKTEETFTKESLDVLVMHDESPVFLKDRIIVAERRTSACTLLIEQ